jgi:hypothetical protein
MICLVISFAACSSSTDSFRPFVTKKAPKYSQRLDTVLVRTGKDRVVFKIPKPIDPTVKEVDIYWNSGTDSLKKDFMADKDTLVVKIDTLEGDQSYSFNFYTRDQKGNRSLKLNRLIKIYGSQYASSLLNRALNDYLYEPGSTSQSSQAILEWATVTSGMVGTKVIYTNQFDESDTVFTPADSSQTVLKNFELSKNPVIKYQTLYLPTSAEIDTFASHTTSTSEITGIKLINSGPNFKHGDWDGKQYGNLKGWIANEALKNQGGYGGYDGGYSDEGQLNIRQWQQRDDKMTNGKLFQTITLPKGSYTFKIFISQNSYMNYGQSVTDLVVAKGKILPDVSELDSKALAYNSISNGSISFKLGQTTQISIGFVSTLTSYEQQLEVEKVRLLVNN